MAAFLTAKNLFPLERSLVYEIPFMGTNFFLARVIASLLLPLFAAFAIPLLMRLISGHVRLSRNE